MKSNKLFFSVSLIVMVALAACTSAANAGGGKPVQPAPQVTVPQASTPQITVVGVGQVTVSPDVAYINVGVRSQADTVVEALEINNSQAKAIKDSLMSQGVDEKDIQTSSFNVYPQSDYDSLGTIVRTYFAVENTVYVTVRNLDSLGKILDAVAKSGANNIYGITFDVLYKTASQSSARIIAVNSAKVQAQELAAAASVELGDIISISTYTSYPQPYYGKGGGGGEAAYSSTVPIAAGQLQLSSEVTMAFAIKQ